MMHWHHKVPRHMGGTDDPDNLVWLTIEEHAEAHRLLWLEYGKQADYMAWKMLSGKTSEQESMLIEVIRERMKGNQHGKRKWSEDQKVKQSFRMKGKPCGRKGPQPEETRRKKSEAAKRQHQLNPIIKVRDDKGRFV